MPESQMCPRCGWVVETSDVHSVTAALAAQERRSGNRAYLVVGWLLGLVVGVLF